jgi:ATP-dependent DNA helicase PIF1
MIVTGPVKKTRRRKGTSIKALTAQALAQNDATSRAVQQAADAARKPAPAKVPAPAKPPAPTPAVSVAPVEVPIDAAIEARLNSKYLFVTGAAGSGKTFMLRQKIKQNPLWGKLTATTGAAARVLGLDTPTMHSALHIFDLPHLQLARDNGYLTRNVRRLRKHYERIVVDEASMLARPMFEIIYEVCKEEDLGLVLAGDFLQLPPVAKNAKPEWLFESPLFKEFKVLTLETQYRQTNRDFLDALNFLRGGDGESAKEPLERAGVNFWNVDETNADDWTKYLAFEFPGTILVATNERKDTINRTRFRKLKTPEVVFKTIRKGEWTREDRDRWEDIPGQVALKVGARVMVLKNAYDEEDRLLYANGDTGIVQEISNIGVEILRDDGVTRLIKMTLDDNGMRHPVRDADGTRHMYLTKSPTAEVLYMPLAQAWATTVHKAQGLTFNHPVCVDLFGNEKPGRNFFGHPAMVYVAVSRVRNPKDLTIVGANSLSQSQSGLTLLEANCNMDGKCRRWL